MRRPGGAGFASSRCTRDTSSRRPRAAPRTVSRTDPWQQVLPRQVVRHRAGRDDRLGRLFAGVGRHDEVGVVHPDQRGAHVRFFQVDRVVNDDGRPQVLAKALPARAHRCQVAAHRSRAPDVRLLEMRRRLDKRVPLEDPGREAAPAVPHVIRRAGPAVHPDRRLLLAHRQPPVEGDQPLRRVVDLREPAQPRRARFQREVPRVRPAHPSRDFEVLGRPALGSPPSGRVEREAGIVAVHAAAVLVAGERTPQPGQIDLGQRWMAPKQRHQHHQ